MLFIQLYAGVSKRIDSLNYLPFLKGKMVQVLRLLLLRCECHECMLINNFI